MAALPSMYTILSALLFYCCDYNVIVKVEGRVTISPSELALVCDGGQLELNCTIVGSVLEWRIIPEQNHSQLSARSHYPTRNASFYYGGSTITFTIIFHSMQLTSYRTVISPVLNNLDGTEVKCTDAENQKSSSTTISVVNAQDLDLRPVVVRFISNVFEADGIEVTLEWTTETSLYSYQVHVIPQPFFIIKLNSSSVQLKVLYNVLYNVSVVKMSPCGQNVQTISELYYVICGHPFRDRASVYNNSMVIRMIGYMDPVTEGATVIFDCPPEYVLIGPNTTTCMGNGEWEPDPKEVQCKGLEKVEEASSINILVAAISSTVVAFVIIFLFSIITGFVCGHYFGRKSKQSASPPNPPVALYGDVNVLPRFSTLEHQEQHLELKENVAYGPLKSIEQVLH